MPLVVATAIDQAAATGIANHLASGNIQLLTSGDAEIASLVFASWGTASTAHPSVVTATITPDTTITPSTTIAKFIIRTSGNATRISGACGVGSGELQLTSVTVPSNATQITCSGGLSLSISVT